MDDVNKREYQAPRIGRSGIPRSVPEDKFLWHNHVQHCIGMTHGMNGFRYWHGLKPINYRHFERCYCGVTELPHYKRRGRGSGKCVSGEQVMRNTGFTEKDLKKLFGAPWRRVNP